MKNLLPQLRKHKSGQYFARLNGKDHYLGKDPQRAQVGYHILVAQFIKDSDVPQSVKSAMCPTVNEVVISWMESMTASKRNPISSKESNWRAES